MRTFGDGRVFTRSLQSAHANSFIFAWAPRGQHVGTNYQKMQSRGKNALNQRENFGNTLISSSVFSQEARSIRPFFMPRKRSEEQKA